MNTKTTHTPGPWKYVHAPNPKRLNQPEHLILGALANGTGGALICEVNNGWGDHEANCHLIAAAPELLAALKAMRKDYEELARNHSGAWHDDEILLHKEVNDAARAAIAKATGGQS
jgi:hypothetical protein